MSAATKPHKPAQDRGPEPGEKGRVSQPDLLVDVEAETWLAERLKTHGHDIYAGGPYETYADRLGACIVRNGVQCVIVGRNPDGKPESYAQLFQRICGKPLPKASDVSRGIQTNVISQTSDITP